MRIGVDYYPEHWDKSLWVKDADLMQKTGVKVVRMGEFAWCRFEPRDGDFHFEWLDEMIDILYERGISVILGTPTSCPPLWFYEKYPESLHMEKDGRTTATGIRSHRCLNSPDFQRYANRITDIMTKRYADNKAVIAWQIDNELEAYFCFCENCIAEYRDWLKHKYGTLEKINECYGNNMWSGEYSSWEQIKPPFGTLPHAWLNPAYMLDFNRYASDNMIKFVKSQTEIIRRNCSNHEITTNVWFCENMPDFYKEFENLDFVSYDNYPTTSVPHNPEELYSHAFHHDMMRGIKNKNFWIMEQLSGGMGCWCPMVHTTYPGMIKGCSLQAFAHGADTVVHFRWRTAVSGAEMHWHGLIDHSNVPGRRFNEFADLCKTADTLQNIRGTEIKSDVAILYSSDNEYAFKIQPQSNGMYYLEQPMLIHSAFTSFGVNIDVIGQHEDISGYKIVVAPEMYVTDESVVKKLYDFAENGGTVILTNRSGAKNEYNNCIMEQLPTVYRKLVGAYVEEYDPMGYDECNIKMGDDTFRCRRWNDILCTETAETVAVYDGNYYKGKAAIIKNHYGDGTAYYIGTVCEKELYRRIAEEALNEAEIKHFNKLPDGVEITVRTDGDVDYYFVFNNTDKPISFCLINDEINFQPFEMKVIQDIL